MKNYFSKLMDQLEKETTKISNSVSINFEESEKCKSVVLKYYNQLQGFASKYEFHSKEEEIDYFKNCKPLIVSKLIFYCKVSKILTRIPIGDTKAMKKYVNREAKKIERFSASNIDFISYLRSGDVFCDSTYFLRENLTPDIIPISRLLDTDKNHTTNGSYLVARMLANIKLQDFLEKKRTKIHFIEKRSKKAKVPSSEFSWTASKVALIELIYALFSQGVINKGDVEIKKIVEEFEVFFNVKLTDPYRSFTEIKQRKRIPTPFIDSLKNSLIQFIEDHEK